MQCLEEEFALHEEEADDVFCEDLPPRSPETMSVGSQAFPPGGPNGILRSQSFAGFSGIPERRSRCNSFLGNASAPKKPQAKQKKMHNLGHKNNSTSKEPQPERVEEVYGALKNGLDEYLEVHQTELDKLTAQLKDMRRNSRLGVLYDLDKQIKTIERYIRRLEFHISKVDELYEAYCIQRRLREGACKMKQAFAMSPSSKAARESLCEIHKSFKEYTENMCTVESEMENLLGEFYIKMKGLAGFARLCPGDQYEIFMRYGRQRWKLKGKIEVNGKQSWDGEEMFFLPLINGLISIKVTELKGLATHILVGSVTCETKDLFAARPQAVAVDINDLGTIKLNLEVTWCPFDVEDLTPSTGNLNKASAIQRRVSIYSQGTPETPTFKEHSFFSNLQDDVFDTGVESMEKRPLSLSFDDLPNGDCTPPRSAASSSLGYSNPEITVTPAEHNLSHMSLEDPVMDNTSARSSADSFTRSQDSQSHTEHVSENEEALAGDKADSSACQSPTPPGGNNIFINLNVSVPILQDSDEVSELKPVELDTCEGNITKQLVKRLTSTEIPATPERLLSDCSTGGESEGCRSYLDGSLEESLQGLLLTLEPCKSQYAEYQDLYHEITHLEDVLKCKPAVNRSRSSSISLTVESALESFDFLNTSDFDDDDVDDDDDDDGGDGMVYNGGGADSVFSDSEVEKPRCEHPEAREHLSEALTEDTGVGTSVASSPLPLTTGNESLDITLVRHLQYCSELIQQTTLSNQMFSLRDLLEKLYKQSQVMKKLSEISRENMGNINSVIEVLRTLIAQILDRRDNTLPTSLSSDTITIFQYYDFLTSYNITDLENYLIQLAKEASAVQMLQTSTDTFLFQKMPDLATCGLPARQEILTALTLLLTENDSDVNQALTLLSSAASKSSQFREKALLYYCEALTQPKVHLQKAACMALRCLQATESIKMLITLCQSDNKEIKKVASETLLSLGEDGRQAYERLDQLPQEFPSTGDHRGAAVATAF
ncbi:hypothetical protein FKM82_006346 [Ascaphus truei]